MEKYYIWNFLNLEMKRMLWVNQCFEVLFFRMVILYKIYGLKIYWKKEEKEGREEGRYI